MTAGVYTGRLDHSLQFSHLGLSHTSLETCQLLGTFQWKMDISQPDGEWLLGEIAHTDGAASKTSLWLLYMLADCHSSLHGRCQVVSKHYTCKSKTCYAKWKDRTFAFKVKVKPHCFSQPAVKGKTFSWTAQVVHFWFVWHFSLPLGVAKV